MSAKKKVVIRKNDSNLLIDPPVVKAEKIPDEDMLLIDEPLTPIDHKSLTNAVIDPIDNKALLSRIQTLEARLNKSEAYAQNLSTQISMLRQTQDRLSQRVVVQHNGSGFTRTSAT
jgi:hypothetical protein